MKRSKLSALDVWMNGAQAGTWRVTPSRGHEFRYAPSWIENPEARPISLSMSLRPFEPYRGDLVANFFDNLLPDNRAIRERIRERFSVASARPFDLLAEIGRDCVGAIQLLPAGEEPPASNGLEAIPLDETQVANALRQATLGGVSVDDDDDFRISIAGAQEKIALLNQRGKWHKPRGSTPTTHILKLPLGIAPSGIDLSTSIENEWLCLRLLRALGLPVANGEIATFEDQKVLIVERFDRTRIGNESIMRVPQEDFAQVTGTPPENKYESDGGPGIKRIMEYLLGSQEAERDRARFLQTQIAFWLLCAIDGHAKNYSVFIERQGRFRLTPGYDVISAYPVLGTSAGQLSPHKVKMAMAVWGKNRHYKWEEIRRSHFEQTARDCGLGPAVGALIDELLDKAPDAIERVKGEIPKGFPMEIADRTLEGILQARNTLGQLGVHVP